MNPIRWLGVLGLLVMLGCSPSETVPTGVSKSEAKADGGFYHQLSLTDALAKAKADGKLVVVDFYAEWCGPCKKLDATTWKDSKVQEWLTANAVAIKIDVDNEEKVTAQYSISAMPTILFLKPDGTDVKRSVGYVDAAEFLKLAAEAAAAKSAPKE
jgi:thiol:disulfide interchange protein